MTNLLLLQNKDNKPFLSLEEAERLCYSKYHLIDRDELQNILESSNYDKRVFIQLCQILGKM